MEHEIDQGDSSMVKYAITPDGTEYNIYSDLHSFNVSEKEVAQRKCYHLIKIIQGKHTMLTEDYGTIGQCEKRAQQDLLAQGNIKELA